MSADGPPPGARPLGGAARSDARGEHTGCAVRHRLALALVTAVAALGAAAASAQGVVVGKSDISFVAKLMGANVEGRFRKWTANVVFTPEAPAQSKAELDVELASLELGTTEWEADVRAPPWLDASKFPVAHFASTSVKQLAADRYEMSGRLTLKGVTRDVVVPITLRRDAAGNRVAEGSFPLKRLDYKVGDGPWADTDTVGNDIVVAVRMVLAPGK